MKFFLASLLVVSMGTLAAFDELHSASRAVGSTSPSSRVDLGKQAQSEIDEAIKSGTSESELLLIMSDSATSGSSKRIKDAGCDAMPANPSSDCKTCCEMVRDCNKQHPKDHEASNRCTCYGAKLGCDQYTTKNSNPPPNYICVSGPNDGSFCPDMTPRNNTNPPGSHNFADCRTQCGVTVTP